MKNQHIPALRRGVPYESLDTVELASLQGSRALAKISLVNSGLIKRDLTKIGKSREVLSEIPVAQLLNICAESADHFLQSDLPGGTDSELQKPEDYLGLLSSSTGLPHTLCRANMVKIHDVLTNMETILGGLTRGLDNKILDSGYGRGDEYELSFCQTTDCLGVVLPSNSPGVNSLWLPAVPLKIPVVLKPGREDPWTPYRIVQALLAAGCPPDAFCFYPTDHEGAEAILRSCGRAIIFGDDNTVRQYEGRSHVQVHGPGRSKVLIGEDWSDRWSEIVDLLVESIAGNSGRSCINASCIMTLRHGDAIADAVGRRLSEIRPLPPENERARLAGFANPDVAHAIENRIVSGLAVAGAEDVTAKYRNGPRVESANGQTYLMPTLVRCGDFNHPLSNTEFLFPYASVVEIPQDEMLEQIGETLVVTAVTDDSDFIRELLRSPLVDRLNIGPVPTNRVQWDQPHEGNLFDFLYRRRAIQRA